MELYLKYRPKSLGSVVGQKAAVETLQKLIDKKKIPHAMLFTGPSGCGKTTLARIVKTEVGCGDRDFTELNCADFRGVDAVREIRNQMSLSPLKGKSRVWLIDECHQLTKDAQNALLKMTEDTPKHVYFFFATTDPGKIIATLKNRCTEIKVKLLSTAELSAMVKSVAKAEKLSLAGEVVERLVEVAEGSARRALVILNQIADIEDSDDQLKAIESSDAKTVGIDIARLLFKPGARWPEMAKILKTVEDEPESIRYIILGYARSILLSCNPKMTPRAFNLIQIFGDNFYDSKQAGLAAACFEAMSGK